MRSHSKRGLTAVLLCVAVILLLSPSFARAQAQAQGLPAGLPAGAGKSAAEVLPEGTLVMVDIPDLGATKERAKLTMIYKVLNDPAVKDYLKPLTDKIDEWRAKAEQRLQQTAQLTVDDIEKLLDGRVAIAFTDFNLAAPGGGVKMVLLISPKDTAHLKQCVGKFVSLTPPHVRQSLTVRTAFGCEITEGGGTAFSAPVAWTISGNTLVLGIGDGAVDGVLQLMAQPGPNLAGNPTYAAAMNQVKEYDQDWRFYASFERPIQLVQAFGGQAAATSIAHLGIEQFKAIAVAGKLDGPAVKDILYVYTPGPQGRLTSLISPGPVDLGLLQYVPAEAPAFSIMRCNVALAYDTLIGALQTMAPREYMSFAQQMQMADQTLGISIERDLLRALGEEAVISMRVMPAQELKTRLSAAVTPEAKATVVVEAQYSRMFALVAVKDAARMKAGMKGLTDYVVSQARMQTPELQALGWADDTYQGVAVRTLTGIPNVSLTLSYAVTDKFLIAAGTVEELKSEIDRVGGRGQSIAEGPLWQKAKALVPEGAGLIAVSGSAAGIDETSVTLKEVTMPQFAMMAAKAGPDAAFLQQMLQRDPQPLIDALSRNAIIQVVTVKTEENGVAVRSYSPVCLGSVLPAVAAPLMGVLMAKLAAPLPPPVEAPAPAPARAPVGITITPRKR